MDRQLSPTVLKKRKQPHLNHLRMDGSQFSYTEFPVSVKQVEYGGMQYKRNCWNIRFPYANQEKDVQKRDRYILLEFVLFFSSN